MKRKRSRLVGVALFLAAGFILAVRSIAFAATSYDVAGDLQTCRADAAEQRERSIQWLKITGNYLNRLEREGQKRGCARQIWLEMRWLSKSTAEFEKVDRKRADFYEALRRPEEPDRQASETGLWGTCNEPEFMKVGETLPHLKRHRDEGRPLAAPVRVLERINSPEALRRHFDGLLVSDVRRDCRDRRTELNSWITDLSRMIFRRLPGEFPYHSDLERALLDYLDNRWQNPDSGFWGAWYLDARGSLVKTDDLSITFHILSYYKGEAKRWPRIIGTLLAMRTKRYPYGWLASNGEECSHHNYDVIRIFRLGWPHMSPEQKKRASVELDRMLEWSLTVNFDLEEGRFKVSYICDSSYEASIEYGLKMWNELGLFSGEAFFWGAPARPEAESVRRRLVEKGYLKGNQRIARSASLR